MNNSKKLTKSLDKKIFGVAGGIANYVNVDPMIIRLLMVALFFLFDGVFLIYLVLAFILSEPTMTKEQEFDVMIEKEPVMVS